ncbi:hypothetical protein CJU90_6831 [Yarrowia sp. C11]|nr:hypothetical protein CJU90_6831 [Yarrowia sp. C11]KAG5364505.1 hypothetical protein CKK34_3313 [Yarrowia sp. E02]
MSGDNMKKIAVRRKRFVWHPDDIDSYYSDDYFSDDDRVFKLGKPRPTPLASLMNLDLSEYELIRFYNSDSTPMLVAATGKTKEAQGFWMENVTKLASSNGALKEACQVFAIMHLGHNHKKSGNLLKNGSEHAKDAGLPSDLSQIIGYTRLDEAVMEEMFIRFTSTVKAHQKEIQNMTLETAESVLLSSVLIYLIAMSMGPYVPLYNFDGGADLFSLGRTISDLTFVFTGDKEQTSPFYNEIDFEDDRVRLPREEDLWNIIAFVETDENLSELEKKRVQKILTAELKNMVFLFHMDSVAMSVSHIAAWCTFWTPDFHTLLREETNTYALLFVCYWCGYAHMWHVLFWWGDRIQEDLLHLKDHLPTRVHHFLEWPLKSCTRFDINYIDLLSGKMRDLYL